MILSVQIAPKSEKFGAIWTLSITKINIDRLHHKLNNFINTLFITKSRRDVRPKNRTKILMYSQVSQSWCSFQCFPPNHPQWIMTQISVQQATHVYLLETLQNVAAYQHSEGQNLLHQFPRNKSVTSWRGQKSVVSVVSCRFSNSITTTCCRLVADLWTCWPCH